MKAITEQYRIAAGQEKEKEESFADKFNQQQLLEWRGNPVTQDFIKWLESQYQKHVAFSLNNVGSSEVTASLLKAKNYKEIINYVAGRE